MTDYASVEDLEAAEFDFGEETVQIETKSGTLNLRIRELTVGRRASLLKGITDSDGRVTDMLEMQVRMFATACVEPQLSIKRARKFLSSWPGSEYDKVIDAQAKLGNDAEVASDADAEFPADE